MKKKRCYYLDTSGKGNLFLCEIRGTNVFVKVADKEHVNRKLPIVTTLPIKQSFFLNVEIPFKSVSKAQRVMDSVLDSKLPFAIDDSCYVFKATSSTALSGAHKFIVFGALKKNLQDFIERSSLSKRCSCITHQGIVIWDGVQDILPVSNEICFVYFEYDNQGCLLFGFNNTLEACYSLPSSSKDRLTRTVKAIKAKYQILFDMAKNVCWTNVPSDVSEEFSNLIEDAVTNDLGCNYFKLKNSENFLQKSLTKQFFKRKSLNLIVGEEFVSEEDLKSREKHILRSAIIMFVVSVIAIVFLIIINFVSENKLYDTDVKINNLASSVAGYNIPNAMKGETVYKAAAQAAKKRKELLQLFDVNPPDSMEEICNVIKVYSLDSEIIIHNVDISQNKIILDCQLNDKSTINSFESKLNEVGYIMENLISSEETSDIPCNLIITKRGYNDE
jgi:hypothetical protein